MRRRRAVRISIARRCQGLFKGASVSEQVYGANSCIAYAGKRILMLAIIDDVDPGIAKTMAANGNCRLERLPELGVQGSIGFECAQGNARASVRYMKGDRHFEFSWIPGTEPSQTERDLLITLVRKAYGA